MIINTNIGSNTAARILNDSSQALQKSLQRLSTGKKNTSLQDDTAGAVVGNKFTAELGRLSASKSNVANLMSYTETQSGYLEQISGALNRMSELAMLATDATKSSSDLVAYSDEFLALKDFIDDMGSKEFNGKSVFGAGADKAYLGIQSDGTAIEWTSTAIAIGSITADVAAAATHGLTTNAATAALALDDIQAAIDDLGATVSDVGSNLSRLESERSSLAILQDNMSAARSRIVDVDVAEESANFAKQQILVQSGTAMLAQANILPQSALRLIG